MLTLYSSSGPKALCWPTKATSTRRETSLLRCERQPQTSVTCGWTLLTFMWSKSNTSMQSRWLVQFAVTPLWSQFVLGLNLFTAMLCHPQNILGKKKTEYMSEIGPRFPAQLALYCRISYRVSLDVYFPYTNNKSPLPSLLTFQSNLYFQLLHFTGTPSYWFHPFLVNTFLSETFRYKYVQVVSFMNTFLLSLYYGFVVMQMSCLVWYNSSHQYHIFLHSMKIAKRSFSNTQMLRFSATLPGLTSRRPSWRKPNIHFSRWVVIFVTHPLWFEQILTFTGT